ncbi:MAG: NFACT family protein [Candidatus Woesearchaeota archaeon]
MVVSLSSMDVLFLVRELQFMEGAKLEKVFQQSVSPEFLFSFHVPGRGKRFVYINLPEVLCLSSFKPVFPDTPPHFAWMLRKRLANARLQGVSQNGFERIIELDFSTKHKNFKIVIELFAPGNIVLTDDDYTIREVYSHKVWSDDRKLLPKKPYRFPPAQLDPRSLSKEDFLKLLSRSDKDSIVKTLAIECSLGGVFAEEVIARSGIGKTLMPGSLDRNMQDSLYDSLQGLFSIELDPVICNGRPYPFVFESLDSSGCIKASSFNDAIGSIVLEDLEREEIKSQEKEASRFSSKYGKIIKSQEAQLEGLRKAYDENQKKGELIYKHYTAIDRLLKKLKALRQEKSWAEIKEMVGDDPVIKKIDEHSGIVQLDLE